MVLDRSLIKTFEISMETGRKVRLIYNDGSRITERTVKALKMEDDKMICYCYLRKKKRSFAMEKILSAELCD